ncbi:MAG: AMP-binding protein, partial [Gammaproteobacteria bacterium]
MNTDYQKTLEALTASDQIFAYRKPNLKKGELYSEFTNIPLSLKEYFELGLMHPEKDWLVYSNERYTYKEIYAQSARVANQLISYVIINGDRDDLCMQNNPEYVILYID